MSISEGKYSVTMDMWPLQGKDFNRIHPFYDNLREGRFTTTRCRDCGTRAFPPRVVCPECLSENLEWVDLPVKGQVLIVTEEEIGVPVGFETPLIHSLIKIDEKPTVFARVMNCKVGELKEGDEVKLVVFPVDPLPVDGKKGAINFVERVFFAFEKA